MKRNNQKLFLTGKIQKQKQKQPFPYTKAAVQKIVRLQPKILREEALLVALQMGSATQSPGILAFPLLNSSPQLRVYPPVGLPIAREGQPRVRAQPPCGRVVRGE